MSRRRPFNFGGGGSSSVMTIKRTNPHNPPVPPPVVAVPRSATASISLGALALSASATVVSASIAAQADLILGALTLEAGAAGGGPGIDREAALDAVLGSLVVSASATGGGGADSYTAEITFPGGVPTASTVIYDMSTGTDIGNYVAPSAGFTQRCIRCRHASIANFFVDFRPDTTGSRVDVVFWNGETLGSVPDSYTRDLASYEVVVKKNGVALADWLGVTTRTVPNHIWGSRWRHQTAQRAIIRTAAQVFSGGWLPNMSKAAARMPPTYSGGIVPPAPTIPTASNLNGTNGDGTPLTPGPDGYVWQPFVKKDTITAQSLGIQCNGDTGGWRGELGMITEWQGDWLLNGTASSLNTMIQQAEMLASDGNCAYLPDSTTGAPINWKSNITNYASSTFAAKYGSFYWIPMGNGNASCFVDRYRSKGDEHSPQVFYIPWVLTEDPYLMEAQQYWNTYALGVGIYYRETEYGHLATDPTGASGTNGDFTCYSSLAEERCIGWGVKNIASNWMMANAVTSPPSWLLAKSYWESLSSDYARVTDVYFKQQAGDYFYTVWRSCSAVESDTVQTFYRAYMNAGFALAVIHGMPVPAAAGQPAPPSWATLLNWVFDFFVQITNGTSGWNRQTPLIYNLQGGSGPYPFSNKYTNAASCVAVYPAGLDAGANSCYHDYATAFTDTAAFHQHNSPIAPGTPEPALIQDPTTVGNLTLCCSATALALLAGATGASAAKTWFDTLVDVNFPVAGYGKSFRAQDGFTGT